MSRSVDFDLGHGGGLVALDQHQIAGRKQAQLLDELLAESRFRELTVFVADDDLERALRRTHRVAQQSTIIVFKDGHEVGRAAGVVGKDTLAELPAKAL